MPCTCGVCPECDWVKHHPEADYLFQGLDYNNFVDEIWFEDEGGYDPAKHGGMPEKGYLAICLAGETGEFAEKIKKAYRDRAGETDPVAVGKELGDILYYLVKMSHLHGMSLADVIDANTKKLLDRRARGKMRGEGDDR